MNPPQDTASTPNFDPLAKPYRWLEYLTFGPYLQRTRTHYLPQLTHCHQALVLGDGDGRFTVQLLRINPQIKIHAIDASPKMLAALQKSAGSSASRITTEAADLRYWQPPPNARYDLIATHFFLDCLTTEEISSLAQRLTPATTPGAQWLVSDFAIPPTAFGRLFAAPLIALLYHAFRVLTSLHLTHLPNHQSALEKSGWTFESHHQHLKGLLISQLWQSHPA
jgi:ubiquinone/menaquinone biosynthesis C-methylase UbiE